VCAATFGRRSLGPRAAVPVAVQSWHVLRAWGRWHHAGHDFDVGAGGRGALRYLRNIPTPHRPGIVEVVDLVDRRRVFYGWIMRVDLPGKPGTEIPIGRPVVVPLSVDRQFGQVSVEWPLVRTESTAQDALRQLQVDHAEPVLRELGFRGSKGRFELPSATHFATIGFTSSPSSTSAVAFFDVVAQVISREEWTREATRFGGGKRPDLRVLYTFGTSWALGGGMGWMAFGGATVEPLATEVVRAIRDAVPEMQRLVEGAT
jgi:hypothetical protein